MKLYKLTDSNGCTQNNTYWRIGETVEISPEIQGNALCTNQVLHAYTSPLLAELMNPAHADFPDSKLLFEVEGDVIASDGIKVGCKSLKVLGQVEIPKISTVQKIAFGILCALAVYQEPAFKSWAANWLSGKDRVNASYASYASYVASAAYAASASHYTANAASYAASAAKAASYAVIAGINFEDLAKQAMEVI